MINKPRVSVIGRNILAVGLLGLIFSMAEPSLAAAQSTDLQPVLDRVQRLERDIRTLNVQLSRKGAGTGAGTPALVSGGPPTTGTGLAGLARIDARLGELEEELRAGTGKVENMTFQLQQINQRLEKLIADVDYRLSALESGGGAASSRVNAATTPTGVQQVVPGASPAGVLGTLTGSDLGATPPATGTVAAVTVQPAAAVNQEPAKSQSVLPPSGPKERYSYAFSLLQKAEYDRAEAAFFEFIELYGEEPLAGNARYWLGETYYVRGRYVKAAEIFLAAYQADSKGAKAPDTLLKLGMSLGNLDKKVQACASFDKLVADFPKASPVVLNKVKSERQKNGCK